MRESRHRGMTLIEVLVMLGIVGLLASLALPAVQQAREASRRMRCGANLRQVGLANQNYVATYGVFPANWGVADFYTNNPGPLSGDMKEYSAFSQLLPYLDQVALYHSINFDLGMTDPYLSTGNFGREGHAGNATAMLTKLAVLLCPSDGAATGGPRSEGTNYRASNGTERWFISHDGPFMTQDGRQNGPGAVTDGLSNTAAFSEKLRGRPGSSRVDPRTDMIRGGRGLPDSVQASRDHCAAHASATSPFASSTGLSWMVGGLSQSNYNHTLEPNSAIPDCVLNLRLTINGLVGARSNHPGGIYAAMADGSVRFVKQTVGLPVWTAIGSCNGGEAVSLDGQ